MLILSCQKHLLHVLLCALLQFYLFVRTFLLALHQWSFLSLKCTKHWTLIKHNCILWINVFCPLLAVFLASSASDSVFAAVTSNVFSVGGVGSRRRRWFKRGWLASHKGKREWPPQPSSMESHTGVQTSNSPLSTDGENGDPHWWRRSASCLKPIQGQQFGC